MVLRTEVVELRAKGADDDFDCFGCEDGVLVEVSVLRTV
jgi:hypothetical protein